MTARKHADLRDLGSRGFPSTLDPRASRSLRETNASILYAMLVGTGVFVVGITGLVDEPVLPRGLVGEFLRDLLVVDPARDVLRTVVGLVGVGACLAQRSKNYCVTAGTVFAALAASGIILSVWDMGALPALSSVGPIASVAYLALGILGLWCGLARPPAIRDSATDPGPTTTSS